MVSNACDTSVFFSKMAVKLHPDQNKDDPNANEKFQELAWCNEVLTDKDKRKLYDKCGEKCVKEQGEQGGDASPFGGGFGGFGSMFGSMFGFGDQEEEHRKGDLVVVPLMVTLEELYNGAMIDMLRTKVSRAVFFTRLIDFSRERMLKLAALVNVTVEWK